MTLAAAPSVTYRAATPADGHHLAALIELASGGISSWLWSGMAEAGETPLQAGTRRAAHEEGGFSYRHALVAEVVGQVAGMILAYRLPEAQADDAAELERLPDLLRPFVELELAVPGSYYINAFALYDGYRGQGIGARLLDAVTERARQAGCRRMSVQTFSQNTRAATFYQRHGFRYLDERRMHDHPACRYRGSTILFAREI